MDQRGHMREKPDRTRLEALVSMAQPTFQDSSVLVELICTTMILLPKVKGRYMVIGLVEVI